MPPGREPTPGRAATLERGSIGSMARGGNLVPEADVTAMFEAIVPVYDRLNTLMTLGADARWRRLAAEAARLERGDGALDAACGTGKLARLLAERVGPFGRVEAVDLAPAMVARAAQEHRAFVQLTFQVANVLALPFEAGDFDAATIAFGLRNLADFEAGFSELARVVRPGGRVVCLELSLPPHRALARLYQATFRRTAPLAAALAGGPRGAYRYLPASLEGFPDAEALAATMRSAGLAEVSFRRLAGGAVALHVGRVGGGRSDGSGRSRRLWLGGEGRVDNRFSLDRDRPVGGQEGFSAEVLRVEVEDLRHQLDGSLAAPGVEGAGDPGCLVGSFVGGFVGIGTTQQAPHERVPGDARAQPHEEEPPAPGVVHRREYRRAPGDPSASPQGRAGSRDPTAGILRG